MRGSALIAFALVGGLLLPLAFAYMSEGPMGPGIDAAPDDGIDASDGSTAFDTSFPDTSLSDSSCNNFPTFGQVCGAPGTNGCAGQGGEGGTGGQGGGAAIALYVVGDSHVTMSNGAFFLAHGGQGGNGGDGGAGANGQNGEAGASAACHSTCVSCVPSGGGTEPGGSGGTGTNGGAGGIGGGGAGGPVYYYVYVDAAAPTITPATLDASAVVEGGGPGNGGLPNGQPGASGVSFSP